MERLKGIGVSAGLAVGPALVAIQRTQVIRFPIAARRITRELSALDRAMGNGDFGACRLYTLSGGLRILPGYLERGV